MSSKFRRKNKQIVSRREYNNLVYDLTETIDDNNEQEKELKEHEQELVEIKEQLNIYVDDKLVDLTNRVQYLEGVIQQLLNMKIT